MSAPNDSERLHALVALAGQTWQTTDQCAYVHGTSNDATVHQHQDGTWWFWDETAAWETGPFADRAHAYQGLTRYLAAMDGGYV